jgi:EAL domain-containing protein (putative c-di-GMP-specific phosphodiesterase class I)
MYQVSGRQSEQMIEDVRWTRVIRTALEIGGFVLHYQPLMHVKTGIVSHYEALLRLKTEHGLVGPLAFLPAAGRFGLMPDIDRWVVEHAVQALAECGTDGLSLSVNLSSFALEDDSFAEHVDDVLKRHGVEGRRIVFEITEQVAVRFAVETDERIGMLRDLGCRLAIDDFGTGYSSFSYLKHLPVDYLKIDGSFIKGVTDNQVDQSMVRMIGEVARAAGIETVAEYVQTEAELRMIAEFNIDYAQGFYIGRPDAKLRPLDVPHPMGTDESSPAHASISALHR